MYFVKIENDMIVQKGESDIVFELADGFIEVAPETYNSIGLIPCNVTSVEGGIIEVEYIPPVTEENVIDVTPVNVEELQEYVVGIDFRVALIELGLN